MQSAEETHEVMEPGDWDEVEERRYAEKQEELAEYYDVDFESHVFETGSAGSIHYLVTGNPEGEPVLLLHGVSTTGATWLPMVPVLTDDFQLYIPDRPGRGLSDAPSYKGQDLRDFMVSYLLELLEKEGVDRPHVVGSSLGGLQAFLLTIDHDCVNKLCLIGAPGGVSREFPLRMRLLGVRGVNRLLFWAMTRGDPVENAEQAMKEFNVVDSSAIPDEFYEVMGANQELPGRERSLRSLSTKLSSFRGSHPLFDLRDEIVEIERPTCFIWGTQDSFWEPDVGRPLAEKMSDAEFHKLEDHGHMPWMEPGDEVENRIKSFFDIS